MHHVEVPTRSEAFFASEVAAELAFNRPRAHFPIDKQPTRITMPSYRRIQVHTYSTDFLKATEIVEEPELPTAGPGNVVVENRFLGINATDVNITNGGYGRTTLPVKCGLEAGQ